MGRPFPFSAIVGQEEMKLSFLVAAVDATVGGVLAFGDRGTGKSTAVRALAALLPEMRAVIGCPYHCDPTAPAGLCSACAAAPRGSLKTALQPVPVVDLPLGATEDRVVGALNLERALSSGEKAFEPGLLAQANRGFLYIDEVNLLEDHLVDLLLDVSASGVNVVEREGLERPPSGALRPDRQRQSGRRRVAPAIARPVWACRGRPDAVGRARANRSRQTPGHVRARYRGLPEEMVGGRKKTPQAHRVAPAPGSLRSRRRIRRSTPRPACVSRLARTVFAAN